MNEQKEIRLKAEFKFSFQYCFTVYKIDNTYPFDIEKFETVVEKPFEPVNPPLYDIPAILPYRKKLERNRVEKKIEIFKKGADKSFFEGRCDFIATVWETGFGTFHIDFYNENEKGELSIEEIVKILRLGSNFDETEGALVKIDGKPFPSKKKYLPLLWEIFQEYFKNQVLKDWFNEEVYCIEVGIKKDEVGIHSLRYIILGKTNDSKILLVPSEYPYQTPGTVLSIGIEGWKENNEDWKKWDGWKEDKKDDLLKKLLPVFIRIPKYKFPDYDNLSTRDKFLENNEPISYLPIKNIFLALRPSHSVFVYSSSDDKRIVREVKRAFDDMHSLHLMWYTQALMGTWIDKRLQEMPSLLKAVEDAIKNEKNSRKILEIQKKLAKMMATERPFLARAFEEPIHLRLWSSGMQQICKYYMDKLGLEGMWSVNFDKLETLGRLYDEIMDYIRICDAEIAESQIEREKKQWR